MMGYLRLTGSGVGKCDGKVREGGEDGVEEADGVATRFSSPFGDGLV